MTAVHNIDTLICDIQAEVTATAHYTGRQSLAPKTYDALRSVPRERFVPPTMCDVGYSNYPLPIGHGQTISQPFIVALMTDLLDLTASDRVLEIGTGSGYQCAVLAQIVHLVFTVEIIPELARCAKRTLDSLNYTNIRYLQGDGHQGWPENAPYDAILVTACAETIPQTLIEQLKPGGRIIIPLGPCDGDQELILVTKNENGIVESHSLLPVAFVPMTSADGKPPSPR